jgi:hypothetical protein
MARFRPYGESVKGAPPGAFSFQEPTFVKNSLAERVAIVGTLLSFAALTTVAFSALLVLASS